MRDVALGELVSPAREGVPVLAGTDYRTVGVYSYGRGLFERPIVDGFNVSYSTYYRIRGDQFVYSKLFAWEGALTVVDADFDGYFVSQEFPTFDVESNRLLPSYLNLITTWPEFWRRVRAGESGMGGRRKRVHPEKVMAVKIPLPEMRDQERIVHLMRSVAESSQAAGLAVSRCETAVSALSRELIDWTTLTEPLGELVTIESSLVDPTGDGYQALPHIGIDRIVARQGQLLPLQTAAEDSVTSGKYLFTDEDVIYSKIRPELRKAVFPQIRGVCSADAYPLRPGKRIVAKFLLEVLLSEEFAKRSTAKSGRTKMPKVNRTELFAIRVPLPTIDDQAHIADLLSSIRDLRNDLTAEFDALQHLRLALLDDLLFGARRIPRSFDELLERAS